MKSGFLALSILLAACSDNEQSTPIVEGQTPEAGCAQSQGVKAECVAKAAHQSLNELEGTTLWPDAAIEVVHAYIAIGETQPASDLLTKVLGQIDEVGDALSALTLKTSVAKAYADIGAYAKAEALMRSALAAAQAMDEGAKKWDVVGKISSALAASSALDDALEVASNMPEDDYATSAYKARTYREIAAIAAKNGDFEQANAILAYMTMGLPYYRATARTDIAMSAAKAGAPQWVEPLLGDAATLAAGFENGYFIAGALREVGEVYAHMGNRTAAMRFFNDALIATKTAPSKQEQARAISRVSTGMSDYGYNEEAEKALSEALLIAGGIESESLKNWSMYEIVGAMGFAGDIARAKSQLPSIPAIAFGSAKSLAAVTQRDVAWGMARSDRQAALSFAATIPTPRERVQALSRIARLIADPKMVALPRYL